MLIGMQVSHQVSNQVSNQVTNFVLLLSSSKDWLRTAMRRQKLDSQFIAWALQHTPEFRPSSTGFERPLAMRSVCRLSGDSELILKFFSSDFRLVSKLCISLLQEPSR